MDMTLSKRGDYVMRSAIYLARAWLESDPDRTTSGGKSLTTPEAKGSRSREQGEDISEQTAFRKVRQIVIDTMIPNTFAPQILAELVHAGLVVSRAGREGGYRLAKDPALISALEVVESAEGHLRADRCALGDEPCRWEDVCPLHETWTEATQAIAKVLQLTTLAELAERDIEIENGTYKYIADAHRSHPSAIEVKDKVQVELGVEDVQKGLFLLSATAELDAVLNASYHKSAGDKSTLKQAESSLATVGPSKKRKGTNTIFSEAKALLTEVTDEKVPGKTKAGGKKASPALDGQTPGKVLLLWKDDGQNHIGSLEGNFEMIALDDERTELIFAGSLRQGNVSQLLLKNDFEKLGRKFVRQFLKELAHHLEEAH